MELSTVQTIAMWGFLIAVLFGAIAFKTNFCTMGAVSDWVNMGDKGRLRAWFLAIGVAIFGTQTLQIMGVINLSGTISLAPNFSWLACLVGGATFGIGMTLGSGCGQRSLVRLGAGNLKSLVVVLLLGVTAYTTFRGILTFIPRDFLWPVQINLAESGIADQSVVAVFSALTGIENTNNVRIALAGLIGLIFVAFAFKDSQFRRSFDNVFAGAAIGAIIVAGWYITGVVGNDDFEPVPVESMSFVLPTGNMVNYYMTYTGSTINFGIAVVIGVIVGAFLYSVLTGQFRLEGFTSLEDMSRHIVGGILMGIGGIVGFGCTIGQGVTGLSTLSMGAALTLGGIIFGSAVTMKVQYYQLDEIGFFRSLHAALSDLRLLPRPKGSAD